MPTGVYIRTAEYREKQRQTALKMGKKPPVHSREEMRAFALKNGNMPPHTKGKESPCWKGGKGKCLDCQKELGKYGAKRCSDCIKVFRVGKNNPRWKGGITPEQKAIRGSLKYKAWRKQVLERDNYTCQKTGETNCVLRIHHIKNFSQFPELQFDVDNGITFSEKAHIEFHRRYGLRNNTREQILEYLSGQ